MMCKITESDVLYQNKFKNLSNNLITKVLINFVASIISHIMSIFSIY